MGKGMRDDDEERRTKDEEEKQSSDARRETAWEGVRNRNEGRKTGGNECEGR